MWLPKKNIPVIACVYVGLGKKKQPKEWNVCIARGTFRSTRQTTTVVYVDQRTVKGTSRTLAVGFWVIWWNNIFGTGAQFLWGKFWSSLGLRGDASDDRRFNVESIYIVGGC